MHYRGPRREREKGAEKIFEERTAENVKNSQSSPGSKVSGRIDPRKNTSRHTVIKLAKIKDKNKILKAKRKKIANKIQGNSH